VNDRVCNRAVLIAFPASIVGFCDSLRHLRLPLVAARADVEFELCEANVRRAIRGAALCSSVFVTPMASLHGADMVRSLFTLLWVARKELEGCGSVGMA
jgi:hypothetical protein